MPNIKIDSFKGLYTSADAFSTPGSPSMENCRIDINGDIVKSLGYELQGETATTVTDLTSSTETVEAASHGFSSGDIVFFHSNLTGKGSTLNNKLFRVSSSTTDTFVIDGDITEDGTPNGLKASQAFLNVSNTFVPSGGLDLDDISILGASEFQGLIYAMMSNSTNSYLMKTNIANTEWDMVDTQAFDPNNDVVFVKYSSPRESKEYLIFCNGTTETISANQGGVFYYSGTGSISLFGVENNPTCNTIEVHNERLWAGNIDELAGSGVDGEHWVMVSKLFPEASDTTITQAVLTGETITKGQTTRISVTSGNPFSSFFIGDQVLINDVIGDLGDEYLNGKYHTVLEATSTSILLDVDTSGALDDDISTSITLSLRGNTWSPAEIEYEDELQGAGIFRMDNDNGDVVQALKSSFGVLSIFRSRSVYFFTGALSTGDATLGRQMDLPYGAISKSVALSDGGVWFVSEYGVNKVEGVSVETVRTELDTISSVTFSEVIKPSYNLIADKSSIVVHVIDKFLFIHDQDTDSSLVLNLLNGEWHKTTTQLVDKFVDVNQDTYSIYKGLVFKMQQGNSTFNVSNHTESDMASFYFTKITDLGAPLDFKQICQLRMLIEGAITSDDSASLNIDLFYDGSSTQGTTISFDILGSTVPDWNTLTNNGTLTWNQITSNATLTWNQVLGVVTNILQRRAFDLGYAKDIQFRFRETSQHSYRISSMTLDYELINE